MSESLQIKSSRQNATNRLEDEIKQEKFKNQYHKAVVNIIYTNNWIISRQTEILRPHGITLQQYNVLRILRGQYPKPATIKMIRERMLDRMSDASRIVEKLKTKGLAERKVRREDRRNVDVIITKKGLSLLGEIDIHEEKFERSLYSLNSEEITNLNCLLDKLRS